ncbi:beta-N-acetylhexosaminidase [Actinoallomurus sp. CA-150999]|uniref:beta-N-acetylhexosaminidase n=1 Tax=Actinoallomurus sp. CA-150999 TaxID=3239887 RepID=UPI003D93FF45
MTDLDRCLLVRMRGHAITDELAAWSRDGLGGVILYRDNIRDQEQLRTLIADLRAASPDLLVAVDDEGGDITRLEAATGSSYPGHRALGAIDDPALTRDVAAAIGGELAALGVNLDLAPVADVNTNPMNPIIGVRSFGADPAVVAAHSAAFVGGLQSRGVAACAKHFPGHGDTDRDSHLTLPTVSRDEADLRRIDLPPFAAAIRAGVRSVMSAHVLVPALDTEPATVSERILTGLLRAEMGFEGVVITDALNMNAIQDTMGIEAGAVHAMSAGADLLCLDTDWETQQAVRHALAREARSRPAFRARLTQAAERVNALAAWVDPETEAEADPALGLRAARRALLVSTGDAAPLPLTGPPYVVQLRVTPDRAGIGGRAASLLATLREFDPRVDGVTLTAEPDPDAVLPAAAGRPLVVAVRDAHRHDWQRRTIEGLCARRPDAVVVATGLPSDRDLAPGRFLCTYGGGRAQVRAAAEALLGAPEDGR